MVPSQDHREMEFLSPLGTDVLLLHHFKVEERLGRLFSIDVTLRSKREDIDFDALLGENAAIRLDTLNKGQCFFNGFITGFSQEENKAGFASYSATLSPYLWFLTRNQDCRIFQEQTAVEIIEKILNESGCENYALRFESNFRRREYTVQYRESDFNFISRLMEEEGIYYFFEHSENYHTVVLCDGYRSHKTIPAYSSGIAYRPKDGSAVIKEDVITHWKHRRLIQSGSVVLNDYNFKKPKAYIQNNYASPESHSKADAEIYDYPGNFSSEDEGAQYARIRQEQHACRHAVIKGKSSARSLSAGGLISLREHPRDDQNTEYLITKVTHEGNQDAFGSSSEGGKRFLYNNKFQVLPSKTTYRSARKSKKAIVDGPQNAVVVGPSKEDIHCDEFGRVKVQFPWDRYGESDENSSCWIRVSQNWAGRKWGAMYIPRIGQEVVVDFFEGDPDKPLITGRVYNADQMPPYDLPENKYVSGIKTKTSKNGSGFNEITMNDTEGEEQIFMHAEKQYDQRTKEDHLTWVGKNQHHTVEGSSFDEIFGDKHHTVKGELNYYTEDAISIETETDIQQKAAKNYAHESGNEIHLKAGMKVVIEAGAQISLKAGGSFIDIGPSGVSINGAMVKINSGGAAASGSGSKPEKAKRPLLADDRKPLTNTGVSSGGTSSRLMKNNSNNNSSKKSHTQKDTQDLALTASALRKAAREGLPFCEECEKAKQGNH